MLYFSSLRDAAGALPGLLGSGPATVELLDAASLRVAQRDPGADEALLALAVRGHAALLVEYREETQEALAARRAAWQELTARLPLAGPAVLSDDQARRDALWHIRKGLYAAVAESRPSGTTALLEDIAVPVDRLRPACEGLTALFAAHGYEDSVIFGHAKDGNIHFMLAERFDDAPLARALRRLHRRHGRPGARSRRHAEGRARHRADHGPLRQAPVRRRPVRGHGRSQAAA